MEENNLKPRINHADFVRKWHAGQLNVNVHRTLALKVMATSVLPTRYRLAHYFWLTVGLLCFPAGLGLLFYRWWVGLLVLLAMFVILGAARKSAMQFMIDYALEDEDFYNNASLTPLISVQEKY